MEAAVLLPVLSVLLLMLMQPVLMLYTRTLMAHAAAEGARVYAVGRDVRAARSFVLRRLEAVPDAAVFHVGGRHDWKVVCTDDGEGVSVYVSGHVRPLPLVGSLAAASSRHDALGVVLDVSVHEECP